MPSALPAARVRCLGCGHTWDLATQEDIALARRWGKPYLPEACPACTAPFSDAGVQLLREVIEHRAVFSTAEPDLVPLPPVPMHARSVRPRTSRKP